MFIKIWLGISVFFEKADSKSQDIARFGNQHAEFVANPKQELQLGLKELEENPIFRQRFQDFVMPMVFNTEHHGFDT